ncbi:MAG: DUF2508 family protein [Oscillospiraceae bacterium]|nr:DUF2508 family protein [Oscillospiraceae bacterium]
MRRNKRIHKGNANDGRMREMLHVLDELHTALDDAYMRFDFATEPELVEACVYEINAAQSRYNYQLRLIRETGGAAAFGARQGEGGTVWA